MRSVFRVVVLALVTFTPAAGAAPAAGGGCPAQLCAPVRDNSAWQQLVLDPRTTDVSAERASVLGGSGSVTGVSSLTRPGAGAMTITATASGQPVVLLDLGQNVGGRVQVRVVHSTAPLRLAYSEARRYMTPSGDSLQGSLGTDDDPDGRFDLIPATSRPETFTSPGVRGGERWITVRLDAPGNATIAFVRVVYDGLRLRPRDYAGHFLSSDPLVNRTWYASVYTENLDAIQSQGANRVLVDGAKRDRLVWLGDLAVEGLTAFYSSPRTQRVLRDSIAVFSCQQEPGGFLPEASPIQVTCPAVDPTAPQTHVAPNPLIDAFPIGSYTPWWIVSLYEYWLYTGDMRFVRTELPAVAPALSWLASRQRHGLYAASLTNELNWHPFDLAAGIDAHTNAVYYQALRDAAALERAVGHNRGLAHRYLRRAAELRAALLARLWDGHAGALLGNAADPRRNHTQDANVYGVVSGVLTGAKATRALGFVRRHLYTRLGPVNGQLKRDPYMGYYISPYISSWELWARFAQGDGAGALDLDRRLFGYMATHDPGTMWEKVAVDGTPQAYTPAGVSAQLPGGSAPATAGSTSLAHGWSSGPASALPAFVLGIRPAAPGFAHWLIAPQPSGLRWAQGDVPSPFGAIVSRWARGSRSFRLTVGAPRNTSGTVQVPLLGRAREIYVDGKLAWSAGRALAGIAAGLGPNNSVAFLGVRGAHTFAWIG